MNKDFLLSEVLETTMKSWLFEIKKQQISNRTFEKLARSAELYIYPQLGSKPLSKIVSADIQYLLIGVLHKEKNLTFATIHKCRCLLNNFFVFCVQANYIQSNPISNMEKVEDCKRQCKHSLEADDFQRIIDIISTSRFWKPFCMTMISTKIRLGEILALTWKDIDFDAKTINVNKLVSSSMDFDIDSKVAHKKHCIQSYLNPLSIRDLPIPDDVVDILKTHKRYREREQRQSKNKYSYVADSDLVFGNEESELRSYSGLSHNFRKYLKNKGLSSQNITLHSLRSFNKEQLKWNEQSQKSVGTSNKIEKQTKEKRQGDLLCKN